MGTSFALKLDGDGAWPDLKGKIGTEAVVHVGDGSHVELALLRAGMTSGASSVMFRFDLPDGRVVLFETSLAIFTTAAAALAAKDQAWAAESKPKGA